MSWRRGLGTALVLLVVASMPAMARAIRFVSGAGVVRGTAFAGENDVWTLTARKGQSITVRIATNGAAARFDLAPPGNDRLLATNERSFEGRVSRSGTYTISVYTEAATASYTLEVAVK